MTGASIQGTVAMGRMTKSSSGSVNVLAAGYQKGSPIYCSSQQALAAFLSMASRIYRVLPGRSALPSKSRENYQSHTCFNRIGLPQYKDHASLEQELMLAVEDTVGFGLV